MSGQLYSCIDPELLSAGDDSVLVNVTGNHLSGRYNGDVNGLLVRSGNLERIPRDIVEFFPNLRGLQWHNGVSTTITADDLRPFDSLIEIYVFQTSLFSIESDLFRYTPMLQLIIFSNNRLEHVGHDLLIGLQYLNQAFFNTNPCIDLDAVTPAEIIELNRQLPIRCPPIIVDTTEDTSVNTTPEETTLYYETTPDVTLTTPDETTQFTTTNYETTQDYATTPDFTFPDETTLYITTPFETTFYDSTISTTTESGECSIGCVDLVEDLRKETQELRAVIEAQAEENAQLAEELASQRYAIIEIEKQLREIWSQPCSPCRAERT